MLINNYSSLVDYLYSMFGKDIRVIVPQISMSAGTMIALASKEIMMGKHSNLGPIDPQVQNKEGKLVAALGYLDKVNELIEKSQNDTLSNAEFIILKDFDLAELRQYEQAKELTIDLLKKWLVKYKFKNWTKHQTTLEILDTEVTQDQKLQRAEEIADALSSHNRWKSHGRPINIDILKNELKLKIEDYSNNTVRKELIRGYYELLTDYIVSKNQTIFVHTKFNI